MFYRLVSRSTLDWIYKRWCYVCVCVREDTQADEGTSADSSKGNHKNNRTYSILGQCVSLTMSGGINGLQIPDKTGRYNPPPILLPYLTGIINQSIYIGRR